MRDFSGKWIWAEAAGTVENTVVVFRRQFDLEHAGDTTLHISADTRYVLSINGREVGRGPIRSTIEKWFYDSYDLNGFVVAGANELEARVWDYGWSTYQTIANKGGLIFDLEQYGRVVACSDDSVMAAPDPGMKSKTVKRNVNLGFMEHYDGNKAMDITWEPACPVEDNWGTLHPRPVKTMDRREVRPEGIRSMKSVTPKRQCVSVNTRTTFFPGRRDANASIMTGFIGVIIDSPADMQGTIEFPNTKWNGMHGDFKIEDTFYEVQKRKRDVPVHLKKGKQLFLMELAAKFDDLYVHMELEFPHRVQFGDFFVIGPTRFIENKADGYTKIYGGLEDFSVFVTSDAAHKEIFMHASMDGITRYSDIMRTVPGDYVFHDEYVLSLVRNTNVIENIPVLSIHNDFMHGNTLRTTFGKPLEGDLEVVVDFDDYYVGSLNFRLEAPAGTVLDIYGFENMFEGEIDFTIGLNNAVRYVCREGYQEYRTLTRMGFRYLMLVFRNMTGPVGFYEISVSQASYPVSRNGSFRCSDYLLNKIYEISKRTNLMCSEDTFADSPAYEQAYWTGDAQVSAQVSVFYFGEYELLRHCVSQVPLSRKYSSLIPALMPTDWETAIPLWTMNWIITANQYVFYSGRNDFINEIYEEIKKTLEYYAGFIRENGAFDICAWNMIDWAAMDIYNKGVMTAQQGILAHCMGIARKMAVKLDRQDDLAFYDHQTERLLGYLDRELWLEDKQAFTDGWTEEKGYSSTLSIQTHMMLYLYDCIICPEKKKIVERNIASPPKDWLEVGSPFMLFYLFEIWHRQNRDREILDIIREKWGMMLRYDSSTCWEVFPVFYENSRTRSYCHSWSSAPGYVFIRYLLGLEPVEPGFRKLKFSVPDVDLEWCEGSIPSPQGKIDVFWSREKGRKVFKAMVPGGIELDLSEPGDWDITIERI
ncbi:MAG: alpha-L-rhamnosidase C-terminal domain-containing protein [Clostridia bacterium]